MDRAVKSGYWEMFRFNPDLEENKLSIDSREPSKDYREFLTGEARFASLQLSDPERFEALAERSEQNARARYEHLLKLQEMYED